MLLISTLSQSLAIYKGPHGECASYEIGIKKCALYVDGSKSQLTLVPQWTTCLSTKEVQRTKAGNELAERDCNPKNKKTCWYPCFYDYGPRVNEACKCEDSETCPYSFIDSGGIRKFGQPLAKGERVCLKRSTPLGGVTWQWHYCAESYTPQAGNLCTGAVKTCLQTCNDFYSTDNIPWLHGGCDCNPDDDQSTTGEYRVRVNILVFKLAVSCYKVIREFFTKIITL